MIHTKAKSLSVLECELDIVFSHFIKLRDKGNNCFVCGAKLYGSTEAGHYMRRAFMPTRYHEMNVNTICFECNRDDDQHKVKYRHKLVEMYGETAVRHMEFRAVNNLQKFMRFEIEELIEHYKVKISELKKKV